jgi:hypothetical protein
MLEWLAAAALGASVGFAELVTRYRDEPMALPQSVSFWVYLLLNSGASFLAFQLVQVFGWTFGIAAGPAQITMQVLVAGLSAMALFRSSLLTLRIGDSDLDVGPSALLTSLLAVVDRAVDRRRATGRSKSVSEIMSKVAFAKAKMSLPAYCLQLMQNVPLDEQQRLRTSVDALALVEMDDELRSLNLGLLLMNTVGPTVLKVAVRDLGARITNDR